MDDKIIQYLTHLINKNVSSIIAGYIIDPPQLPFLSELAMKTEHVRHCLETLLFYRTHYYTRTKTYDVSRIATRLRISRGHVFVYEDGRI